MEEKAKDGRNKPARPAKRRGRPAGPGADTDPAAIDAAIRHYRARGAAEPVRGQVTAFTRRTIAQAHPDSVSRTRIALSQVSGLASWALSVGIPLRAGDILRPDTIERYATAIRRHHGAGTTRSTLRWVGEQVNPQAFPPQPPELGRPAPALPYTDDQVAAFLALAAAQPTPLRRQRLTIIICLGAGAGLTAAEMAAARPSDLTPITPGALAIQVGGAHPRLVPISPHLTKPLLQAASNAEGDRFFPSESRLFISRTTCEYAGGQDLPKLNARRLRNTWLVNHLQAMDFPAFLKVAGMEQSPGLFDLAAHLPQPTPEQAVAALCRRFPCM